MLSASGMGGSSGPFVRICLKLVGIHFYTTVVRRGQVFVAPSSEDCRRCAAGRRIRVQICDERTREAMPMIGDCLQHEVESRVSVCRDVCALSLACGASGEQTNLIPERSGSVSYAP